MIKKIASRNVLASHTFFLNRGIGRKELVLLAPRGDVAEFGPNGPRYCVTALGVGEEHSRWAYLDTLADAEAVFDLRRQSLAKHYPRNIAA